jgi:hypothetical protein
MSGTPDDGSNNGSYRSNGRGEHGYFAVGNKFAAGNGNHRRMSDLRRALLGATTPEQVAKVVQALAEKAAAGDVPAAKVYLDHVCGRPMQAIEVSGLGGAGSDVTRLRAVILEALADDPAARFKVARALLTIGTESDGRRNDAGDGA